MPRRRLCIDPLEDRLTPALSVQFDGSTLTLTGSAATGTLLLTQNAGSLTVVDGPSTQTFAVTGDVRVRLTNAPHNVTLALGANDTLGSVFLDLGNGPNTVALTGTGSVAGDLSVRTGNGTDSVSSSIDVAGNATFVLGGGPDAITLAGDVGGNLQLVGANTATLGPVVGGLFQFNATEAVSNTVTLNASSLINGNAYFVGGSRNDFYTAAGDVGGTLVAQLGAGTNFFSLPAGGLVVGGLTVIGGVAADTVNLAAGSYVGGGLTMILGNGPNAALVGGTVAGPYVTYHGGSGVDLLTFAGSAPAATFSAFTGNGNDTITLNSDAVARGIFDFGAGIDTFVANVTVNFPLIIRNL